MLARLLEPLGRRRPHALLVSKQLLTLLQTRRRDLALQRAFAQLFQLAGQLGLEPLDTLAEGLPPCLPVAAKLALVQLLLLETGDGLPAEKNLLLAAGLLGLRLLAGHRQVT